MSPQVLRLFPTPSEMLDRHGLYLNLELDREALTQPLVYANFLSSLDGRIAVADEFGNMQLPKQLTSASDFRLFLELHAQADCLITHGGYLRALAAGRLGNILQVGIHPAGADLLDWRLRRGLPAQPAVVVVSGSLDFEIPVSVRDSGQRCLIATTDNADPRRVKHWQAKGYELIVVRGETWVDGGQLAAALEARGFRTLYLIAGPRMLETMAHGGRLARLFQTTSHQLLGGADFHTILPGGELNRNVPMVLRSLYYDAPAKTQVGQWYAQFECKPAPLWARGGA